MSYLTESLKIAILMMIGYGDRARTQCEVVRLFRNSSDLPPLNQGTISKIEAQYREMGHVRKVPSKRQAVVDDDTKLNLLLALEENPITPARQLARDIPFSHVPKGGGIRKNSVTPLSLNPSTDLTQYLMEFSELSCTQKRFTDTQTDGRMDGRSDKQIDYTSTPPARSKFLAPNVDSE
ncbi:hypothetical protein NQ318_013113 [Aromia moschata]|uniref:DUF4817 domain-containing protein n=1 Tax=Aromia moschata TaxID=1265417 RepID=A0AAV8X2D7_9CUCU|nr:hypothetical protein NQ318_013113 [Aromia moschata]